MILFIISAVFLVVIAYVITYDDKPQIPPTRHRHERHEKPRPPAPRPPAMEGAMIYRTGALDEDRVLDIVETYRRPPSKPSTYAPVEYAPPEKPATIPPKVTMIVGKSNAEPSSVKEYTPNSLIAPVIERVRGEYQLPPGAVEMPIGETAVISAVILYFIQGEPEIGITKLESYIIMLDKMCYDATGRRLFSYRLTYGAFGYYMQNFRAFLDFLQERGFLTKRREYYTRRKYRMDFTAHVEVTAEIFPPVMIEWMNGILRAWRGAGARHTKRSMVMMLTGDSLEAFTRVSPYLS